jgi:cytochrome c peroxidase
MRITPFALLAIGLACDGPPTSTDPVPVSIDRQLRETLRGWGTVPIGPVTPEAPALVALGQALIFDPILSGNRDISCATCHQLGRAATDGLSLAVGTGGVGSGLSRTPGAGRAHVGRNAPSLLNQGLGATYLFWDGRLNQGFPFGPGPAGGRFGTGPGAPPIPSGVTHILTAQAMLPVLSRDEMRGLAGDRDVSGNPNELAALPDDDPDAIWRAIMARLVAIPEYVTMFRAAFPSLAASQLRFEHAAEAIAAFEIDRLTRKDSPFDRYLARDDGALSAEAKRGALLFFGRAQCASCHSGPLLGGQQFANIGIPQLGPGVGLARPLDAGFGETLDIEQYRFAFRVPPLRNVALTAPYMHNGAYPTLDAVVRHYKDPTEAQRTYDVTQIAPELRSSHRGDAATIAAVLATLDHRLRRRLELSETELRELVVFLEALTDPAARDLEGLIPARVPSGLPVVRD